MNRIYLDWNATAPLRLEARDAMIAAMDSLGNPSSVHGEGRSARAIIEKARAQVAEAFGANAADIVFTSGSTEAAALALSGLDIHASGVEHDCVAAWAEVDLTCDNNGLVDVSQPETTALQAANSESGALQKLPQGLALVDFVQAFGKIPVGFDWSEAQMGMISSHKIGGPMGVGALAVKKGIDLKAHIKGGGHEMGRRAGTENLIGIAGFGAAAQAAVRDLNDGVWEKVQDLRDGLEAQLQDAAPELVIISKRIARLPNTSFFAIPGWKSETQVMQMDLAGCAVSAGSACSSGKVKSSRLLTALGYDDVIAASAIRVSIGPSTTKADILQFADIWLSKYKRFSAQAA